jgi:hypothetical protein
LAGSQPGACAQAPKAEPIPGRAEEDWDDDCRSSCKTEATTTQAAAAATTTTAPVRKWPPVSQPGGFRSMIRHARRIREWLVPLDMAHHRGRGYWRIHLFRIALLTSEASGTAGRLSVRLIASPAQSQSASEGGSRKTGWPRPWSIMTGAFLLAAETIWSWNTRFASSADWPCLPLFVAL